MKRAFEIFGLPDFCRAYVSLRSGGNSTGNFDSLNMSFKNDDYQAVLGNRILFSKEIEIPVRDFVFCKQVHSNNALLVREKDRGAGSISINTAIPDTDALYTTIKGCALSVLIADCAPVFFACRRTKGIAIAHCGRAGSTNGLIGNVIDHMKADFGSVPKDIFAVIGPHISAKNYPIPENSAKKIISDFSDTSGIIKSDDIYKLDLSVRIESELLKAGLKSTAISKNIRCTFDEDETFFSERRQGAPCGRMIATILST
ncbi:MAG: peptidoglycan editing factor PgeF [Pseudomonadota bacterium]